MDKIHIIGGGLAGSEAAWQLAERGHHVVIHEMRPVVSTEAHKTDRLGELVCSNTFKSTETSNAHGLLKAEMRLLGCMILQCADDARVPGGSALTVDRDLFSAAVTARITSHPNITVVREEASALPSPGIVATGPLTSSALAESIRARLGVESLAFYDAIAPIVSGDSVDMDVVFRASRYGRETMEGQEEGAYLNCPMSREQYEAFIDAVTAADQATAHEFDAVPYFEGCMPAEEMAKRGRETLRFGPMKPVGLVDPRTGREAYAVVQLRQDNLAGEHYRLVGFQTQIKWGEQARVLRMIPGLEQAEFVRFGMVHRNTYINGPTVLAETWQVRKHPSIFFAGQMSGVEGYVESAASGLLAGMNAAALATGHAPSAPPRTTAIGALAYYVSHAEASHYQPSNITFGIMEPMEVRPGHSQTAGQGKKPRTMSKLDKKLAIANRALEDLAVWMRQAAA